MMLAVALDWLLGAPRRWHPLAGFRWLTAWLEQRFYARERWHGVFVVVALVLPLVLLAAELAELPHGWGAGFSFWALYFTLGGGAPRDPVHDAADSPDYTISTCESVLLNNGVFGVLFWFLVAGAPGAILYRLAHILNAQWGHKDARHREFGWAAAQLDDLLGVLPARLAALSYALLGHTRQALDCWREQAPAWHDPNAGPLLAAGAGALGIGLGGDLLVHDEWRERPLLGSDTDPVAADIERARTLVRNGVLLWLLLIGLGATAWWWFGQQGLDWNDIFNYLWENLLA